MIHLRKMRASEFSTYLDYFIPDYAAEISANYDTDMTTANTRAEREVATELGFGVDTPGQVLLCIVQTNDATDTPIGFLWCAPNEASKHFFISDLYVYPAQRGHGFAKLALKALEDYLVEPDYSEIRLRVAAENNAAQKLYLSAGFRVTGINMSKTILRM